MRKKWIKKALALVTATAAILPLTASPTFAATTLYDQKTTQTVTKGVTYEKNHRLTDAGFQDIYTLTVDLTESTLKFHEVESTTEYGLKETVQKLLQDNGAIAGVNADFFGLSGTYSTPFGPTVVEGETISAGTNLNTEKNEYAAFFENENGDTFFDYFTISNTFNRFI